MDSVALEIQNRAGHGPWTAYIDRKPGCDDTWVIRKAGRIREVTDAQILDWLQAKAMERGIGCDCIDISRETACPFRIWIGDGEADEDEHWGDDLRGAVLSGIAAEMSEEPA